MKQITFLTILLCTVLGSQAQDLRITEIMYNPSNADSAWEWVEVYNAGTELVNLTGYVIDDNSGAEYSEANIQSGSILSGQSAILFNASALSESDFLQVWGTVNLIPVSRWSALNNSGDTIGIWNSFEAYSGDNSSQENVIEQVQYLADGEIWPEDDGAASIYLTDLDVDNEVGTNWSLSTSGAVTPLFKAYTSTVFESNDGEDVSSPGLPGTFDTEKPMITCPEAINMISDEDNCGATFPLVLPTATDNITTELQIAGIRNDGLELTDLFPIGETTITWTATDEAGNVSDGCSQTITITDEVPPILNCPEAITVSSEDGNPVTIEIELATGSNACDGELNLSFTRSDDLGLQEAYPVGITTITWKALDASNNMSECEQVITVNASASTANAITSFSIVEQLGQSEIDAENNRVTLKVPFGTDVTALIPTIEISEDATITPDSNTAQNFELPVSYTVTSGAETEQVWIVIVEIEEEDEEEEKPLEITAFVVVNADTNEDLFVLEEGMQIDVKDLPTPHLAIRAEASGDVESVRLSLDGALTAARTENVAPFALFGDSPNGNYNGNIFTAGTYTLTATPYGEDDLGGNIGEVLKLNFELNEEQPEIAVTEFILVNADTNDDLFLLTEGMQIDVSSLPTLNLDIRANTSEGVESVQLQLEGSMEITRTENFAPYALNGDSPVGVYNGAEFSAGIYKISAFPFTLDGLGGEMGVDLSINFELVDSAPILSVTSFALVNADTNEDILVLTDGMQIELSSLPTLNLDIRANASDDVESVSLTLSGAQTANRTENVVPFALFGDFPAENYNGNVFEAGDYSITAIGYAESKLKGEIGESLSIDFQLVDTQASSKQANQMKVYPNPASNEATLMFKTPEKLAMIYLYDALGREVGEYYGDKVKNEGGYTLDVNSIPNGIYYIKSYGENGGLYQKQIMIKK